MSTSPDNRTYSYRQRPKRKRVPSQYTRQITFLKQQIKRNSRLKQETSISQDGQNKERLKQFNTSKQEQLMCKLPNGKKFQIAIIVNNKNKGNKLCKKVKSPQKVKEQAPKSLLDIFQSALFKVQMGHGQANTDNTNWEGNLIPKDEACVIGKQVKVNEDRKQARCQKDSSQQKVIKVSERFATLNAKLEQISNSVVLL